MAKEEYYFCSEGLSGDERVKIVDVDAEVVQEVDVALWEIKFPFRDVVFFKVWVFEERDDFFHCNFPGSGFLKLIYKW